MQNQDFDIVKPFVLLTAIISPLLISVTSMFFKKHRMDADTHRRMSTYFYEHTHEHPTSMSIFKRLSQFDLEIHEVSHQERASRCRWERRLSLKE
jgi:hypothetical protein